VINTSTPEDPLRRPISKAEAKEYMNELVETIFRTHDEHLATRPQLKPNKDTE
jgi:hypothetical protein